MLSSTSVSSIGNIHRRVIVFPFRVPGSGSVWCSERSRGGLRVDLAVRAIWVADGFFFTNKQCKGAKDSSQMVWGWLWQKAPTQSFIRPCRSMLHTDRGPVVYDEVPKKLEQKWDQMIHLSCSGRWKTWMLFFPGALNFLWLTQNFCQVCVWRYLRCWVLNRPKPQTRILHKCTP